MKTDDRLLLHAGACRRVLLKVCAVLLTALLAVNLTLPILKALAQDDDAVKFAVATDIHVESDKETLDVNYPENELYFFASGTGNLYDQAAAMTVDCLHQAVADGAEFVLIPGDLTRHGNASEHQFVSALLADFEAETGIQVYVVPGNHDYYDSVPAEFKGYYAALGYDTALAADEATASYTADLNDRYRLIAVDSNDPGEDGDGFTPALLTWIETQTAQARADGKEILYMMHHPLLEHLYLGRKLMKDFVVQDGESIAEQFCAWGVKYIFTGHEHGNDIAAYTAENGAVLYDILTTALSSYPLEYRMITLSQAGADIQMQKIETCRLDQLIDGYTDQQKALLESDYEGFAYEYFKFAIEKKILRVLDSVDVKELLKVQSGPLVDTAENLLAAVNDALVMPLYDNGEGVSIEGLAESKGVTIPASDYGSLIELASAMVAAHYYGDENLRSDQTPECEIIVKGLNTGLQYVLTKTGRTGLNTPLRLLGTQMDTEQLSPLFRAVSLGREDSYLVAEQVLYPLLDKFAVDFSVADRDVFLPAVSGEEAPAQAAPLPAFLRRILALLRQVYDRVLSLWTLR